MRILAGMAAGLICLAASVISSPVRTKIRPWAPAELWPATRDMLAKLSADFSQTAVVLSLWAERPAHQCVVEARYAEAPADFGWLMHLTHQEAAEAPAGARAMLARLNAAGFAIGDAPTEAPAKQGDAARRAA